MPFFNPLAGAGLAGLGSLAQGYTNQQNQNLKNQLIMQEVQNEQRRQAIMRAIGGITGLSKLPGGAPSPQVAAMPASAVGSGLPSSPTVPATPTTQSPDIYSPGITFPNQTDQMPPAVAQAQVARDAEMGIGSRGGTLDRDDPITPPPPATSGSSTPSSTAGTAAQPAAGQSAQTPLAEFQKMFPDPVDRFVQLRDMIKAAAPPGTDPGIIGEATMLLADRMQKGDSISERWLQFQLGQQMKEKLATGIGAGGAPTTAQQRADTAAATAAETRRHHGETEAAAKQRIDIARERMVDQKANRLINSGDKALSQQVREIMAKRRSITDKAKSDPLHQISDEDMKALQDLDKQIEELEGKRSQRYQAQ